MQSIPYFQQIEKSELELVASFVCLRMVFLTFAKNLGHARSHSTRNNRRRAATTTNTNTADGCSDPPRMLRSPRHLKIMVEARIASYL